jgi:CRISPR-associated protein Csb2
VARFSAAAGAPKLTAALPLAERVHFALVELSDGSSVFTGCDGSRRPLQGHAHAQIFCESCAGDGDITHVIVFARSGFGPREQEALQRLKVINGRGGPGLRLALQDLGTPEDFRGQSPLLARSRAWFSHTPFLPTRHPKRTRAGLPKVDGSGYQIGSPEHELLRLLKLAGFPEPVAVEPAFAARLGGQDVSWSSFVCRRENGEGRRAANGRGYGFRIEFPEAVQGPVAVGYGAHFGMGGFGGEGPKCIDL